MKKDWSLVDENKTLLSPFGVKICLPREAVEMIVFGSLAIVLLSYQNGPYLYSWGNVVAYDESGTLLWQTEAPSKGGLNRFTGLVKNDENTAILSDSLAFTLYVNPATGEVLRRDETR